MHLLQCLGLLAILFTYLFKTMSEQIKNMTLDHYEKIAISCSDIAKQFAVERIPVRLVDEVLVRAKVRPTSKDKTVITYLNRFNKTIDTFKEVVHKQSEVIGDEKISIHEIRQMVDALKESFLKGVGEVV